MKKILMILALFFMAIIYVNAETNNGLLYEKYWQEAGVNVFAKDTLYGVMDYNGWMIVSSTDDKVYYCIQPELEMYNAGNAVPRTHTIYRGEDIVNNSRLTNAMSERVKLLAYYGYKYKNHTDKKWYGITQVLIWRTVITNAYGDYKNTTWSFKDSRYGNINNSLYINEVKELETLVANHGKMPSFDNKTFEISIGESLTIKDDNKVLNNFIMSKSNIVDIKENGNELIITAKEIGEDKISLTNDVGLRTGYELYSSSKQDLITRGEITYVNSSFDIKVTGGKLILYKKDKENNTTTPQGDATLLNAKYNIYDEKHNLIKEVVIDKQGKEINLPFGNYIIKEIEPPLGYNLNEEEYKFSLTEENKELELDLYDLVIKGTHIINKTKGGAGEDYTEEKDAVFKVIDQKGNVVGRVKTFKKGVGTITLPYGKYKIVQEKGAEYYSFVDDYEINIKEEKQEIEVDIKNIKYSKLIFTKKDYVTDEALPNTFIEIYKDNDTLIFSGKTNDKGNIELPNLEIGRYYIIEKEAPKYYETNNEKLYFEVLEHGRIIKCEMKDKKIKGSLKVIKKESGKEKVLQGVEFSIYDMNNKLIYNGKTNQDGEILIDNIDAGKYYLIENKTIEGYNLIKGKTYFEIENQDLKEITIYNNKITNPSTMDKVVTYLVLFIISSFTLCTVYAVNYKVKES